MYIIISFNISFNYHPFICFNFNPPIGKEALTSTRRSSKYDFTGQRNDCHRREDWV
jgi:hypothetical protein